MTTARHALDVPSAACGGFGGVVTRRRPLAETAHWIAKKELRHGGSLAASTCGGRSQSRGRQSMGVAR
jgi:hypothetical protein